MGDFRQNFLCASVDEKTYRACLRFLGVVALRRCSLRRCDDCSYFVFAFCVLICSINSLKRVASGSMLRALEMSLRA